LQKIDTTLLLTNNEFSAIIHLSGLNQFRAGVNYLSNRFISSVDSVEFDTRTVLYKGSIIFNTLDNGVNPSKGLSAEVRLGVGNRQAKDSTGGKDLIYRFNGRILQYFKISEKNTLMVGVDGGAIVSPVKLWPGELFRFGGMYSVRGFDEQSVTASKFFYTTFEYRYRFERRSNAFIFSQLGDYEMKSLQDSISSYLFTVGTGAMLDTGAGVFSITYALGTSSQQPMKLKTAKIHFGYLVNF
jgi:hemolysin activation/secretion protein